MDRDGDGDVDMDASWQNALGNCSTLCAQISANMVMRATGTGLPETNKRTTNHRGPALSETLKLQLVLMCMCYTQDSKILLESSDQCQGLEAVRTFQIGVLWCRCRGLLPTLRGFDGSG